MACSGYLPPLRAGGVSTNWYLFHFLFCLVFHPALTGQMPQAGVEPAPLPARLRPVQMAIRNVELGCVKQEEAATRCGQ